MTKVDWVHDADNYSDDDGGGDCVNVVYGSTVIAIKTMLTIRMLAHDDDGGGGGGSNDDNNDVDDGADDGVVGGETDCGFSYSYSKTLGRPPGL